jgi:hypothetical protein
LFKPYRATVIERSDLPEKVTSSTRIVRDRLFLSVCVAMDRSDDPIQVLTDISGEMQRLAESLRVPNPSSSENDIPEIYSIVSSLR